MPELPTEPIIKVPTREAFHKELARLQEDLVRMGSLAGNLIHRSVQALVNRDFRAAEQVIHEDSKVDQLHLDIEQRVVKLLATQQPMASDLRMITSALAISIDLERLADHAEGIAKAAKRLNREPMLKPLVDIPYMESIVQSMLSEVLQAYTRRDPAAAEAIAAKDDTVDALRSQIFRELLTYMSEDQRTISRALELILVSQNLERAADHVTNIAERIIFMVTGELKELNT